MYNNFDVKDISGGKGGLVELKVRLLPEMIAALGTPPRIALADPNSASKYVTPVGLQKEVHFFTPISHEVKGEELTMVFDRDLTNSTAMQPDAAYLVIFEGQAGQQVALIWGQVAKASDQLAQEVRAKPVVAPKPAFVPPASATQAPVVEPVVTPVNNPVNHSPEADTSAVPPIEQRGPRWPLPIWATVVIGSVLLLALLSLGAWLFLTKIRPDLWESLMSGFEQTAPTVEPVAETLPVPPAPTHMVAEPALRNFERGRAAFEAGDCTSARDILQRATEEGDIEALLFVPAQIDSRDFKPCLTEQPNDVAALRHLTAACGIDAVRTAQSLGEIEAELNGRANRGDVVAAEVLRLSMPKARAACGL